MRSEAIIFESVNRVNVRSIEFRRPGRGEVLLETLYSTVSPGTELRTLAGREKTASPFPLIPGYSTVARVAETGEGVIGLEPGTLAALRGGLVPNEEVGSSWGGHGRYVLAAEPEVFVLPPGHDPRSSTLITLLATALHGVDLARVRVREQVAVVGLGLVGQLTARLLHYAGAKVVGTDLVESRRAAADTSGIQTVEPQPDLRAAFAPHFPYGAEAVVDATGSAKALKSSLGLLRERPRHDPCGADLDPSARARRVFDQLDQETHLNNGWHGPRLIAQGSYADPIQINYYDLFSQEVGFVVPRVHELKEMFRAIDLLSDPRFSLAPLVDEVVSYRDAPRVYQTLRDDPGRHLTVCFDWQN
jgi:3-hydroxyethyl bacteriochlorophyllide a dehydrogenase